MRIIKPTISLFTEDFELMKAKLSADEMIAILSGISDLCMFGETEYRPENSKQAYFWQKLKTKFNYDLSAYRASIENGKKGGAPKGNTNAQKQPRNNPETTQKQPSCHLSPVNYTPYSCHLVGSSAGSPAQTPTKTVTNKKFTPPTVEEVAAYCHGRNNGVDAEKFVDFYQAKGWFVGKNKMKDWRAAVRTWEREGASAAGGRKAQERAPWCGMTNEELEARF